MKKYGSAGRGGAQITPSSRGGRLDASSVPVCPSSIGRAGDGDTKVVAGGIGRTRAKGWLLWLTLNASEFCEEYSFVPRSNAFAVSPSSTRAGILNLDPPIRLTAMPAVGGGEGAHAGCLRARAVLNGRLAKGITVAS